MREIICSGGEKIQVDDGDYDLLSRHKWHFCLNGDKTRAYAITRLNVEGKKVHTVYMHNLIMGFGFNYDHRDNNPQNNQKYNLRKATYQENGWNKGKAKGGRFGKFNSQYKGVSKYTKADGTVEWRVIIKTTAKGVKPAKHVRRGPFNSEIEAAIVYNEEIVKLRGKFAWVNPILSRVV